MNERPPVSEYTRGTAKSISDFLDGGGLVRERRRWTTNWLDLGSGEGGDKKKEQGVRGDVQIEVDQAVNEKAGTPDKRGQVERYGKRRSRMKQTAPGFEKPNTEERGAAETAKKSSFGEGFDVVVVGMIDDFAVIESFVPRINGLKSSEAGAEERMVEENVPRSSPHRDALAIGNLEGLHGGESLQDLANSEPGNHGQGDEQDGGSGDELLPFCPPHDHPKRENG